MKINLIGMILNNCGRRAFDGAILDDNGKPMSAADSLHTMILEYAKVIHGGESSLVTTSREVTAPATQEHRRDHAFQGPPMTSELTKAAQQALDTAPAPAVPSGWSITDNGDNSITVHGPGLGCTVSDVEANERRVPGEVLHALCRAMLTAAPTPPAQDAEHAGLVSANGHLSTLLSESTQMLAQLRAMVDALHDEWSNGGRPERGEFSLLDRVDDWLNARPSEMLEPQHATPAQPAVPESADTTPPAQTGIRAEFLDAHIKRTTNTVGRMVAETADQRGADAVAEFVRRAMQHVVSLIDATPPAQPAVPEDVARDAERYRWLRDNHESGWAICEWQDDPDGLGYYRDARAPEVVDAAIDAARKAGGA